MATDIVSKAKDVLGMAKGQHAVTLAGQKVHDTGYGLMGLTWRAQPAPREQAFATMKAALDAGANFWNGGEFYGTKDANSLHLLNAYFAKYPEDAEKVVISIKGGLNADMTPDGSVKNVRASVENCNKVLDGKKKLDIFECARVDSKTPIEITMAALDQLKREGKLGAISLSEVSAKSIRRAAKVTKIAAVEVEVSMWATEVFENGVAAACAEHDIVLVAYSPLGRGFLTGQIRSPNDIPEGDFRKHAPRFQPGNFEKNLEVLKTLEEFAKKKNVTPGQVALAWVKAQSRKPGMPVIVPIPGSSSPERLRENMIDVELSDADVKELDAIVEAAEVEGGRYPEHLSGMLFGDSPELTDGAMEAAFAGQ